jgi:hypothetical protein
MTDNESLSEKLKKAEVFGEFCELMFAHEVGYSELLEQLEKWSISSSMGALSRFKSSNIGQWSMDRAKREERDFLIQHGADLDEVTRNLVAVRIFQAAANPNTSSKDVLKIKDMLLREAQMKQDLKKLEQELGIKTRALDQKDTIIQMQLDKIAEMKAEAERQRIAAEEAMLKATKDGGMTDETVKIIRRAMGMKVDEEPVNL